MLWRTLPTPMGRDFIAKRMAKMETSEKPITAAEIFKEFFSDEKLVTLANGMKFLICKIDLQEIMTTGQISMPIVKIDTEKDLEKIPTIDREKLQASGKLVLRRILAAGCRSPKFVEGPSNPDANEIGLDDARIPGALKTELQAHIYGFNGYAEAAREFFRLVSPGQLDGSGPSSEALPQQPEPAAQS